MIDVLDGVNFLYPEDLLSQNSSHLRVFSTRFYYHPTWSDEAVTISQRLYNLPRTGKV